jgi:2-keto-4-pentenoate hydratase/2-oxohepta-3-ene-1,7-dioic acid hydratase in catechol pathway
VPVIPLVALLAAAQGCGTPVVKPDAMDPGALARPPVSAGVEVVGDERRVAPGIAWMSDVRPREHLVFAALRRSHGAATFAVVVACDPGRDRLALLPLADGETPLDALADADRRAELETLARADAPAGLVELPLEDTVRAGRLGVPLPPPRRVYAVAANYPSHVVHDLGFADAAEWRSVLAAGRPRVFLKHPATPAPGAAGPAPSGGIIGPYDDVEFPALVLVPGDTEDAPPRPVAARIDYEVEVGAVIGRRLDAATVGDLDDDALRAAVAGLVLVSDAKARNPQVLLKVRGDDLLPADDDPFRYGDDFLDAAAPIWDEQTCRWWSYAASFGRFTSIGPFFVARGGELRPGPAIASARGYAAEDVRGRPVPAGRAPDTLYLRQCAPTTTDPDHPDALYADLPAIIRSILAPGTPLGFADPEPRLEPGDVICLGTPGGVAFTSRPYRVFDLLEDVIFFWKPIDWHDALFDRDAGLYLRNGDRLFLWGEGLGFQLLTVRSVGPEET